MIPEDLLAAARAALVAALAAHDAASAQRAEMPATDAQDRRLLYRFERAAEMLDGSRTCIFDLVRTGQLEAVTLPGGGRRIPADALRRFVDDLRARQDGGPSGESRASTTSASSAARTGRQWPA